MDSNGHPSSLEVFTHTKKKKNTTINIKVGELEDEYNEYIYIYIYKSKKEQTARGKKPERLLEGKPNFQIRRVILFPKGEDFLKQVLVFQI